MNIGVEAPLHLLTPKVASNQGYERESQVEHLLRDLHYLQEVENKRLQELEELRAAAEVSNHFKNSCSLSWHLRLQNADVPPAIRAGKSSFTDGGISTRRWPKTWQGQIRACPPTRQAPDRKQIGYVKGSYPIARAREGL